MIEVLYADEALLAFDKPAGLLAVPGRGPDKQDCLSARARARWPDALIVHRLDMATSGLLLMARGPAMQRALSMAFQSRTVQKRYVAVVAGRLAAPDGEWGSIDLPIALDWPNRPLSMVDPVNGKASVTRWRVLGYQGETTRVELQPVTGRSHQLRVHMLAIGHPILGDPLYGPAEVRAASGRLLLHARSLCLIHPLTGLPLSLACPEPF